MFENRETIDRLPDGTPIYILHNDWSIVDLSPGARVARGMLYIQRAYPDALSRVDIGALDIATSDRCVLGQLHGGYFLASEHEWFDADWFFAHGFVLTADDGYDDGTCEWALSGLWRTAFRAWASKA